VRNQIHQQVSYKYRSNTHGQENDGGHNQLMRGNMPEGPRPAHGVQVHSSHLLISLLPLPLVQRMHLCRLPAAR